VAFSSDNATLIEKIDEELRLAIQPSADVYSRIVATICTRIPALSRSENGSRIARLAEANAWTDAAIALLELELPAWQIRRLGHENEEWICSLSRQPNLPMALDDCAEAPHKVLPLAILRAFVEARRMACVSNEFRPTVPRVRSPPLGYVVCCDNFS
jgi:hypothetical protein